MQTTLVRNVAIVAAANGVASGRTLKDFWPHNPAFWQTETCDFLDRQENVIATDPNAWITQMKGRYRGAWLHHVTRSTDDRNDMAFANGGPRRIIECVGYRASDLWEGNEGFTGPADDAKLAVHFLRISDDWHRPLPPMPSISKLSEDLRKTLTAVLKFAEDEKIEPYNKLFHTALQTFTERQPSNTDFLFDLAEFSPRTKTLWTVVNQAWWFGGMAMWNDMSFDGEKGKRYDALSIALFDQLNDAMAAVANSTYPKT